MGEAAILASFAWLVGCLIYLQYGLAEGNWYEQGYVVPSLWINNFWLHYIVVSLIVYIIIIVVFSFIRFSASPTVWSLEMVTGS